jgi:predicted  nucleic acid-binding Zn-ribbon protein
VNADSFSKLKEFDSLTRARNKHLAAIKEQEDRLLKLHKQKSEKIMQTEKLKQEMHSLQQLYFDTENKMKQNESQAARLTDIGGDEQKIIIFKQEAAQLEDVLLEQLEKLESIQQELKENGEFLKGLEKTLVEISQEAEEEIKLEQTSIDQLELRIHLIEEELPTECRSLLQRTLNKKLALGPFTRIENGSCFFCRYKISRIEESEIDMQKQLKTCPQCSRIFLPYGS